MQKRSLGNTGIEVPVIMLGGNVFGWTSARRIPFRLLDRALDAGLNFIDTADVYSRWVPGHTGRRIRNHHRQMVCAQRASRSGRPRHQSRHRYGRRPQGLKPAWIKQAAEDSLRRLATDRIDLYQSHRDDETRRSKRPCAPVTT